MRVRAAAKLDRRAGGYNANAFTVLLSEHRNGATRMRLFDRQDVRAKRRIIANHLIDSRRDRATLLRRQRTMRPSKVESHAIDADPRTGLRHIFAQYILERTLQEVSGRVVASNLAAPCRSDGRMDQIADRKTSGADGSDVRNRFADILRVRDVEDEHRRT